MDEVIRRHAEELHTAINATPNRGAWFGMSRPTFVAAGRLDGRVTVLVNSGGWRIVHHLDGEPIVETFRSAAEAVAAADALAGAA